MDKNNALYKNQGIHIISSIFTVDKGELKVLLIKRKNNPYNGMWALVGGALYNNEDLITGINREVKEKVGLENVQFEMSSVFSNVDRSPVMRMLAVSYIGIVDFNKVEYLKDTEKTSDARLFSLNEIPELAYDHNEILTKAIQTLKEKILSTNIISSFFPNGFTLPELQMVYEAIFDTTVDKRNFRKKLIQTNAVISTGETVKFIGNKPAELFKINTEKDNIL